jgi:hypothetical protein
MVWVCLDVPYVALTADAPTSRTGPSQVGPMASALVRVVVIFATKDASGDDSPSSTTRHRVVFEGELPGTRREEGTLFCNASDCSIRLVADRVFCAPPAGSLQLSDVYAVRSPQRRSPQRAAADDVTVSNSVIRIRKLLLGCEDLIPFRFAPTCTSTYTNPRHCTRLIPCNRTRDHDGVVHHLPRDRANDVVVRVQDLPGTAPIRSETQLTDIQQRRPGHTATLPYLSARSLRRTLLTTQRDAARVVACVRVSASSQPSDSRNDRENPGPRASGCPRTRCRPRRTLGAHLPACHFDVSSGGHPAPFVWRSQSA